MDDFTVVIGIQAQLRGLNRSFDCLERGAIKRFNRQRTRFWYTDGSQLHKRGRRSVIFDWQSFHKAWTGSSRTNRRKIVVKDLDSTTHARLSVLENIFYHHSLLEC